MNKKLLIPVLAIAFLMLATPIFASGATTGYFVGKRGSCLESLQS
ncbi:MAG: hypothetical protein ABSG57_00145 [Candidatus Bathyarchaeia archaeon]